jgi:putative toxin-antitoxin system antitoxin component (TIGR02293 family)
MDILLEEGNMGQRNVAAILGGRKVLGKPVSGLDFADLVKQGLPQSALEHVKEILKLSDREVSSALGVSEKTAWRLRHAPTKRLTTVTSDRLYRLARIFALAEEVLEDREQAREWLRSAQVGLNNRVPFELIETEAGAREVEDLLLRIEYGVLS